MWWLFDFFGKEQSLGRPASPFENARVLPRHPRLQVEPRADLHAYCVQQLATLNSYGWEDQHNGVVRIPVDRAMDLILQQGLPARAPGDIPAGVSNPAPFVPQVEDAQGPCGFVTERDLDHEMSEEASASGRLLGTHGSARSWSGCGFRAVQYRRGADSVCVSQIRLET